MFAFFFCNYGRNVLFFSMGDFIIHVDSPDAETTKEVSSPWTPAARVVRRRPPGGLARRGGPSLSSPHIDEAPARTPHEHSRKHGVWLRHESFLPAEA